MQRRSSRGVEAPLLAAMLFSASAVAYSVVLQMGAGQKQGGGVAKWAPSVANGP
jgi:hypothetical protein